MRPRITVVKKKIELITVAFVSDKIATKVNKTKADIARENLNKLFKD